MKTMKFCELVFDTTFYIRRKTDRQLVSRYAREKQAGAVFPPVLVDKRSRIVVDGFHRAYADEALYGAEAPVAVTIEQFPCKGAMLRRSIAENKHGKPLDEATVAWCLVLGPRLRVSRADLLVLLNLSSDYAAKVRKRKIIRRENGGEEAPLKATFAHMAGQDLTDQQFEVNERSGGMRLTFYVNQIRMAVLADMYRPEEVPALLGLRDVLNKLG